uniref:Secreted protein n=1 Tax=Elaeophora elaphi TaxID=1147741 RepID=A0A0R3RIG9_9BILA
MIFTCLAVILDLRLIDVSHAVFDDPHQLIPSYHEYSITNSPTHSYSPTSGDSVGMPEYFISRGASTAVRSGGLGFGSHASEQGDTVFCEPQQRLQEPKVISNESNRVGSYSLPTFCINFKQVLEVEQNA